MKRSENKNALGVDIGGTKIRFCHIKDDCSTIPLGQVATALLRRGTVLFAHDLVSLIRPHLREETQLVAVSLNAIVDQGRIPYSSLMGGRVDFPLQHFLQKSLGVKAYVDDDIHAMTQAEYTLGCHGQAPLAMLNLGTGIGVGYHDGIRVLRGLYGAGLISECPIFIEELGQIRSLDTTACGRGVKAIYEELSGFSADAITIFARAREGEAAARTTVAIFTRTVGRVLQMISRFYHPAHIVLNGSIKHAANDYLEQAIEIYQSGIETAFQAQIMVSKLDYAGELGTFLQMRSSV